MLRLIFLGLVTIQALVVILDRTGVSLPIPAKAMSGVRLAVSLLLVATIVAWVIRERMTGSSKVESGDVER